MGDCGEVSPVLFGTLVGIFGTALCIVLVSTVRITLAIRTILHDPRNRLTRQSRRILFLPSVRYRFKLPWGGVKVCSNDPPATAADSLKSEAVGNEPKAEGVQAEKVGDELLASIKKVVFSDGRDTMMNRLSMALFKRQFGNHTFHWEVPSRSVRFDKLIGQGAYGSVYQGGWLGTKVAIKVLHDQMDKDKAEKFVTEIAVMTELHHPNVVLFLGACVELQHFFIVMEYLPIDLYKLLHGHVKIDLVIRHRLCADIARGMKYLHRRVNLIQRDLKSKNIMIDENLNGKICDFGLSRHYKQDEVMTFCGTPYWTAPEIIRQEPYTVKADVYSYGIVMWEIMTSMEPYGGANGMDVAFAAADQGLRPSIDRDILPGYADLMQRCWADDPDQRPGFSQILDELFELKRLYPMTPWHQAVNSLKSALDLDG